MLGQGDVGDRLRRHRGDPHILEHAARAPLYVTWSVVPRDQADGVESYLADKYAPVVGKHYPAVRRISVNGPWDYPSVRYK